jgi:ABC-type sulfate/molybdate transport systems ATPase subunit
MTTLCLEAITRRSLSRLVLDSLSFEVADGECVTLLGQSGSGRAALLRVIAGLEEVDEGRIMLDGRDITRLPARRRPIAHLIGQDRLLGHATVFDAVAMAFPEAAEAGVAAAVEGQRVQRLLDLLGLAQDAGSMPAMLTAGKRRRLLLARALATAPRLLLVGEGFAPPREAGRPAPRHWLREVQQAAGIAMLLVGQSAEEALALGDRVAVLEAGRLEQIASPAMLRRAPASPAVARLLGPAAGLAGVMPALTAAATAIPATPWLPSQTVDVVAPGAGIPARVLAVTPLGTTLRLELELLADGRQVAAEVSSLGATGMLPLGTIIGVRVRQDGLRGAPRGVLN